MIKHGKTSEKSNSVANAAAAAATISAVAYFHEMASKSLISVISDADEI